MSRNVVWTSPARKGLKRFRHNPVIQVEISAVVDLLAADVPLPAKYCDHALHNNWEGCRDCHVRPDVVLTYKKTADGLVLMLLRVGSHSEVF